MTIVPSSSRFWIGNVVEEHERAAETDLSKYQSREKVRLVDRGEAHALGRRAPVAQQLARPEVGVRTKSETDITSDDVGPATAGPARGEVVYPEILH